MMEQMTKNDADGVVDEDNEERLYLNTVVSNDDENSVLENEKYEEEEYEEGKKEEAEGKEDIYKMDEFWDEEPGEGEYEEERYGERSYEDEEAEEEGDAPSDRATISAAEKPEEEVQQDLVGPDHVLAEIPIEIFASHETMLRKLKELLAEQRELRRRNRLLEMWIVKHMRKMQEKVISVDLTKESEQMEQIYRQTLLTYKQHLDDITEWKTRIIADMQSYEDRVQKTRDENVRVFDELLDREREVATDLIYAKTGRMLTKKAVNEITRRQVSRREILVRNRYDCILLQHRLEKIKTQLRNLETLGEGMTAMDYEALHAAHINYRDKLDERDRELEKLRCKIAEIVNGVAHYKEKEICLAEDIEFEERKLNEYREQTARVREDVNKLHLILRDLRWAREEKRLEGGLLMALPVLRETERMIKLLDATRDDIEIIKREIHRYGPANGRRNRTKKSTKAMSTMTQDKSDRF